MSKKKYSPIFLKNKQTKIKALVVSVLILWVGNSYSVERAGGIYVGAYGSIRFELGEGKTTFTLRRIVPTFSASVEERLKFYTELEFERFGLLELQEEFSGKKGGLYTKSELEGSKGSEIKLEQMWGEFELSRAFRIRAGALLPPVGRFNIFHDDDLWESARRPLSVRDATVLPAKTAWTEIGAGILGNIDISDMLLGYEAYILNGVTLEHDMEFIVIGGKDSDGRDLNQLKIEAVIKPNFGNFKEDTKREKALTGRISLVPALGYEFGLSGYTGRYTPSFLPEANIRTGALDFKIEPTSSLSIEGEYIYTKFSKVDDVLAAIVDRAFQKEGEIEIESGSAELVSEIALKKRALADTKHGGWAIFRLKFFPDSLKDTPLNVKNSKFILFLRPEFIEYRNTVAEFEYENGRIKEKALDTPQIFRWTLGLSYRPVQTFVFSVSFERTELLKGKSFIHSSGTGPQNVFLAGFAFGL